MPEEGEQGLPREPLGDEQAAVEASESSLWSEWVLLQEGDRAEIRGLFTHRDHPSSCTSPAGYHLPAQGRRDLRYCPVPLPPGTGGIYLPRI